MARSRRPKRLLRILLLIVFGLAAWAVERSQRTDLEPAPGVPPSQADSQSPSRTPSDPIAEAYRDHRSEVWVEGEGTVQRLLADDNDGSRHQRFIVRLDDAMTLLLSHNIDLASRIPAQSGDRLRFRGLYEWNAQGGVVHWTHHDPRGRHSGGWIRLGGKTYR